MGIFSKRPKYALSDILKGLHNAVNSAQEMLQAQQVQNLTKFWQTNDGAPVSQKLKVGDRELNVPLMSQVRLSGKALPTQQRVMSQCNNNLQ